MPQTIGVEVEFLGISRATAAEIIATVIGGKVNNVLDARGKPAFAIDAAAGRWSGLALPWMIVDDISIHAAPGSRCELNTPVLVESELPFLVEVVDALAEAGARVNDSCGIHVHVGCAGCGVEHLVRLIEHVVLIEPIVIGRMLQLQERRRAYAAFVDPAFVAALRANPPRTWPEFWTLWYGTPNYAARMREPYHPARYRGLNLHRVMEPQTVEFRYFNGTLDAQRILEYARFCLGLTEAAGFPLPGDEP